MTAPRVQPPLPVLLASLALFSLAAAAQPEPAPRIAAERVIAISGAPDEPPPVLYAAPDAPLLVTFDAPLRKETAVTVPGADVRPHPFLPNALVITPSKSLAGESSVPLLVPMAEGTIALKLAFSRTQRDATVRIVHRAISGHPAATQDELDEALSFAVSTKLNPKACPKPDGAEVPRQVPPANARDAGSVQVCGGGALAYIAVTPKADCKPGTARLARGAETADVLLVREATEERTGKTYWLVVARAPSGDGRGFRLELLADGGALCKPYKVDLKP